MVEFEDKLFHLVASVGSVSAPTIVVVMMIMSSFETASASATSVIVILWRRRQLRLRARLLPVYIQNIHTSYDTAVAETAETSIYMSHIRRRKK